MAKDKLEKKSNMKIVCGSCGAIFTGKKCPECGNTKKNEELAGDEIPVADHERAIGLGTRTGLRTEDDALSAEYLMSREMANSQAEEMHDNLRETFLIKSRMKKLDLEAELRDKEARLDPPRVPVREIPQPEPQPMQMPNMFTPQTMNPQAQFMNHFMKFTAEERDEFLEGLAEADPAAMAMLSGFFTQQQPAMQPQMPMNPYMQQQMNPYMQYPQPWMQSQQQEAPVVQKDPAETAIDMMDKLQTFSERHKTKEPSELSTILNAMREEQAAMRERMDAMISEKKTSESDQINQRLGQIEGQLFTPKQGGTIREQISGIKDMVDDLREIGVIDRQPSNNTVDEQLRIDQAKHDMKKEDQELQLQQEQVAAVLSESEMKKNLVSGLFSRHLHKDLNQIQDSDTPSAMPQQTPPGTGPVCHLPVKQPDAVVVEEFNSEAGSIRETKTQPPGELSM